jgi:hypothetical protein
LAEYVDDAKRDPNPEKTIVMLVELALDLTAHYTKYPAQLTDDLHHDIQEVLLYTLVGDVWMSDEAVERMDRLVKANGGYARLERQLERDDKKAVDDWW